jgi:hypothetical protein
MFFSLQQLKFPAIEWRKIIAGIDSHYISVASVSEKDDVGTYVIVIKIVYLGNSLMNTISEPNTKK